MNKIFLTGLITAIIFCTSCSHKPKENKKEDQNSVIRIGDTNTYSDCDKIIRKLVLSTDADTSILHHFDFTVEEIRDQNIIVIKFFNRNDEHTDVAIKWLEIDIPKNEIRDVTLDPEHPIILHYDKKLFSALKDSCVMN